MSQRDKPSIAMDVVSNSKESRETEHFTLNFHKHEYSLSELPPLEKLDGCSDETRAFIMETYRKEQDFRHMIIRQEQENFFALNRDAERARERQQRMGLVSGCIIAMATLIWSAFLIMQGHGVTGLAPIVIAISVLAAAVAWGKKQKPTDEETSTPNESVRE